MKISESLREGALDEQGKAFFEKQKTVTKKLYKLLEDFTKANYLIVGERYDSVAPKSYKQAKKVHDLLHRLKVEAFKLQSFLGRQQ